VVVHWCLPLLSSFYTAEGGEAQENVRKALADSPESINKIGTFFYDTTRELAAAAADLLADPARRVAMGAAARAVAGGRTHSGSPARIE